MNFMATNLKPLASKRLMISPTSPRWTPSGLIMIKVRSWLPAIIFAINERNDNKVQIIDDHTTWNDGELKFNLAERLYFIQAAQFIVCVPRVPVYGLHVI